jgi:hypothetical protein
MHGPEICKYVRSVQTIDGLLGVHSHCTFWISHVVLIGVVMLSGHWPGKAIFDVDVVLSDRAHGM